MTCPICLDDFTEEKATPCGHSFCLECIRGWAAAHEGEAVHCPVCRRQLLPAPVPEEEVREWPVRAILDRRNRGRHTQYLVLWGDGTTSWEPKRNLDGALELLREFTNSRRAAIERINYHRRPRRRR